MSKSSNIRKMVIAAMCTSIGIVLPMLVHGFPNGGRMLLPMHFPVLLSGLLCGPVYGLLCGILTPLISSLITGMPAPAYLPQMLLELATYGFVSGLLFKCFKTKNPILRIYISLIGAMIVGRIIFGVANSLIFSVGNYSLKIWITGTLITSIPGIIAQIVLIPPIVLALDKSGFNN